jgi:hypothetical protein
LETKRDEVTGDRRRMHNEELYDLYCPPNTIRVIKSRKNETGWECGKYGRQETCMQGFGGKT